MMRKIAFLCLWLYIFTLPWDYILQFGEPIGSAGRVSGLLALASCIAFVLTTARMRRLQPFHLASLVYLAIVTVSLFWTIDPDTWAHAVRVYLQSVMTIWLLWELAASRVALFRLATAYIAGAYVAAISVFHNYSSATVALGAREARFAADNWDVNDIALVMSLAIPLAFYVASKRQHWISTWLSFGYLIVGPIAIVLTSSRSGMTVMAIALSSLPVFLWHQPRVTQLITSIALAGAACLAWIYAPPQTWTRLSTLFSSLRVGDLNGRQLTWQSGLRAFSGNYFVGAGPGAFQTAAGTMFSAHNTFLAVLVEQGVLGFSVFAVILTCAVHRTICISTDARKMCVLLLLCWAVGAFTLGWAMNRVTWFVLGLVVSFGGVEVSIADPEISEYAASVPVTAA